MPDPKLLLHLKDQPGWEVLRALAKERMETHFNNLARQLMAKDATVEATDLQYRRGFFAGMKFLLDQPDLEVKRLERAITNTEE